MSWDDLRFLLAVHRRGSYKAAARTLNVNPTTVARRLSELEAKLEVKLVTRTPERALVTPAGAALALRAERIEAEVLASERELKARDNHVAGSLRVTASDGLVHYVLIPELTDFWRLHPEVTLEFRSDTQNLDLSRREADVALRLSRPIQPALVARRLGDMPFALFAAASYLEKQGSPRNTAALTGHRFIGFDASLDQLPQVKWLRKAIGVPRYVVRANTTTTQALACAEGHGVALLPVFVAAREPRLRRLLPRLVGPTREVWGVTHADLRGNARVRVFLDWVARLLEDSSTP